MKQDLHLYAILRRMLIELNSQVVDHGDRVAYLYLKMGEYRGLDDDLRFEHMMLACFAHDIGAYKTEKFLDLLRFDVSHTLEHCVYGYLFMKYFSPLREDAEVLLYHHSPYNERDSIQSPLRDEGFLIHLLDRVDILSVAGTDPEEIRRLLREVSGRNFAPDDVEDFIAADLRDHLIDHLRDGSYAAEVDRYFSRPAHTARLLGPVIDMLAYEIDFLSEQTVVHSITTTLFAGILGKRLGLDDEEIEALEYAARLHDLGKIRIPLEILEKPGKLTAEEYTVMKRHVGYTEEITADLFPASIVRTAARHHERLDGSGYPEGLTEPELTLPERILQVADVASALLQKRSYKDAMDKSVVIRILTEESDAGRLDPLSVRTLVEDYDTIVTDVWARSKGTVTLYESMREEYAETLRQYSSVGHGDSFEEFGLFSSIDAGEL